MREIKKGDIVSRHSYNHDIIFLVKKIIKLNNKYQKNSKNHILY